jgi:uncharacterized protein
VKRGTSSDPTTWKDEDGGRERGGFTLFDGEAMLVPERDFEELWSWGFQKGSNGIQTNGILIDENHIRMF